MAVLRARRRWFLACIGGAALAASVLAAGSSAFADRHGHEQPAAQHVLLLSVDGLHQSDLQYYVDHNPSSALAQLTHGGVEFTNAQTPVP